MLRKIYNIAGHFLEVGFADGINGAGYNYEPFVRDSVEDKPLFRCEFSRELVIDFDGAEKISDFDGDTISMSVLSCADGYIIRIASEAGVAVADVVVSMADSMARVRLVCEDSDVSFAINNVLMLLYTLFAATHNTILMHSSVVIYNGMGYMFLGKSGTGKSTQSRMWLENIAGTELLNDDNPVVRVENGVATVYGTPWSGKTPCYKNMSVPVGGIVRIRRAEFNKIEQLRLIKAYASLIPSCSCIKWDRGCELGVSKCVEAVISVVKAYDLECLPNGDAARCCCEGVTK